MNAPNWKNKTVWTGDNLDVMRGMNSECVDLIYLDPPFNKNQMFSAPIGSEAAGASFKDAWTLSDVDVAWTGLIAEAHPGLYRFIESAALVYGKSMQAYLIYMAVRLIEMRRILKETGSIFLHCDPTAGHYLKVLMDSIFGSRNFRREVVWNLNTSSGYKSQVNSFVRGHDLVLYYTRSLTDFTFNKLFQEHKPEYLARFRKVDAEGRKYRDDRPGRRRQYLDETPGVAYTDVWSDVMSFQQHSSSPERTGYPTQKPLGLIKRIIRAASNRDDMVLDPFCGCATTCIAAEMTDRQWAGIDLSEKAISLVQMRLQKELGMFNDVIHRSDIPRRTDLGKLPSYRTHRHTLFGLQEGICAGCRISFPFRNLTVDHRLPVALGGTDHVENLQLLCGACNSMKGTGTQEELIVKLRDSGIIQ